MFEINPEPFDPQGALRMAVADLFSVETVLFDPQVRGAVRLYGHFLIDPAEAYGRAYSRLSALGYTPLFREEKGRQVIVVMPGRLPAERPRLLVAGILFALTVLSVLLMGIWGNWDPERSTAYNLTQGLLFALALLAILLAHEMGHYVVARRLGVPVTLPYFIPMPINPLGTMGAVIQMKAPPRNKRHLLAVGVAGPLAGLVVALPVLIVGLIASAPPRPVVTDPAGAGYLLEGNSILYALLKAALFGRFVPDCNPGAVRPFLELVRQFLLGCPYGAGEDVLLTPLAFAGWAGLLVTGLNLLPAGQLDGGHVAYALLGRRARYLTNAVIAFLVVLGLWGTFQGIGETVLWFIWAGLIFFMGWRDVPPLDDITRLKPWQVVLALGMLLLFVLTFVPVPLRLVRP